MLIDAFKVRYVMNWSIVGISFQQTMENIVHASEEELGVCPGLGPQKVGIMKPVHQTCLASLVGLAYLV